MEQESPGYILVLTLLMISIGVVLVTHLVNKSINFTHFTKLVTDREQAKLIAASGIEIALQELSFAITGTAANKTTAQLSAQLPYLNTWQTFTLTQTVDGIDALCQIYITCENGKIDLNSLYDYKQKKWQKAKNKRTQALPGKTEKDTTYDAKKVMTFISNKVRDTFAGKNIVEILDQIFRERTEPIEDLSVLLTAKDLQGKKIALFPELPTKQENKPSIAVSDIFTIFTHKNEIEPILLAPGLIHAAGFKPPLRTKEALSFIKEIKPDESVSLIWDDTLGPWYGVQQATIPGEFESLFSKKLTGFEGKAFSVVSYGTSGTFTQKLCVVLQQEEGMPGQQQPRYVIKRWYWL
jgi:hypothetical protein